MASTGDPLVSLRAEAVGDWEAAGSDGFYSRELLYDMAWQGVDMDGNRFAAAPFGGPIAVVRDERTAVTLRPGGSVQPIVRIFSAAGLELGRFLWEGGAIRGWGWSDDLELVVVEAGGQVHFYSQTGTRLPKELSFGKEVEGAGVSAVAIAGDSLVLQAGGAASAGAGAGAGALWGVTSLREPRAARLAALPPLAAGGAAPLMVLAVLQPRHTLSGGLEVLVGCGEALWVVDDGGASDHALPPGCGGALALAVSPCGAFVALHCADGKLRVMSSDLSKQLSEFDTHSEVPPEQLAWCGSDAVALLWEGLLLLVGPYGDFVKYTAAGPLVLVPEADGLRVVGAVGGAGAGAGAHQLLRRVARCVADVYRPGSTAPPAVLWDARELYDSGSARADVLLRQLQERGELQAAVSDCVSAAGHELSLPRQRALLRAAVFGRAFCGPSCQPRALREVAVKLRVVNALRDPPLPAPSGADGGGGVGIPLTVPQLDALTLPVLVSRLVAGRHYLLAFRVACMLGSGQSDVVLAWGCDLISARPQMPDHELKAALVRRMGSAPQPRYAALAAHAQSVGRRGLAIQLLEEEPSAAQQVPLLLALARSALPAARAGVGGGAGDGDDSAQAVLAKALRRAVEAGDPDLIYLALFAAYRQRPLPEFWSLLTARPTARRLFVKYATAKEPELLETIYATQHMVAESAELALREALRQLAAASASGALAPDSAAVARFVSATADAGHKYGQVKDNAFHSRAASELSHLVKEQVKLERDTGQALFAGLSLNATLATCIRLGYHKPAAQLRRSFSVPDARWYRLKISALATAHDWAALESFGAERRPPVGWEPFIAAAREYNAPRDVHARLISRLPDSAAKAEAYAAIDCPREAAEVAAKLRDGDLFARIQAAAGSGPAALAIAQLRDKFASTFR